MSDYSLLGSFSTGGASGLNAELVTKLKDAESSSKVDPITEEIDALPLETEKMDEIKAQIDSFIEIVDYFDIYSENNVFNEYSFDSVGSSAVFDKDSSTVLEEGLVSVSVDQLATKDIFQSKEFAEDYVYPHAQQFGIYVGSDLIEMDFENLTLEEMADKINLNDGLSASVEETSNDKFRLIIQSEETGLDNAISIPNWTTGFRLGLTDSAAHVSTSQNMMATVNGVSYDLSSNTIELASGLEVTAVSVDDPGEATTLTIARDTEAVGLAAEALVSQYNDLYTMINTELDDADSVIQDKDMLETILDTVKDMLFDTYGAENPEFGTQTDSYGDIELSHSNVTNNTISLFSLGFELSQYGTLSLDSETFEDIISGDHDNYDFDDLKNVFTGSYENKGVGGLIKDYLDSLDSYEGSFYNYDLAFISREEELSIEQEEAIDALDIKYDAMSAKFAAYATLITQLESSFSSLGLMIAESTSDN